ncbi:MULTISPECIES: 2-oxoacid:acceptor oxidoreductase family protein [Anaeromyxobacter]|uniref:2-oxoacid:acceptor oxidoreductase family protein n=1 Tax=Anaeromyxobacter TaxID=161492 RepID=UPI001F5658FC|nr:MULTISPECIES: 2-oxoacid:acceptor oxidoreductase family protein [unclassified Anaeromyxobacter]
MSVFYERFERHDHAEGIKGRSTHYCPGCGHGLVHRYLAEAIEELGIQDRTIAVSPVGCSVFLYYYLDVGHTQAAHGRAPAVALGHKLSNPDSVVVSYQGDGDLASIGLTEILHAAQLGVPLSVVFVNNAIYGMTGGQTAPTTLMGQKTTTSPHGRDLSMGLPLKMAELIAQLDGPVYVERVALFDAKQRVRAAKAVKKGLELQAEGKGFSFVEVLAECPTHLRLSAEEAERWVKEKMVPVFPLGVKKDVSATASFDAWRTPTYAADAVLEAIDARQAEAPRYAQGFPATPFGGDELGLKFAGSGGDGAQTAAMLMVHAAVNEGLDATHIPSYGPESRGGTSYADVRIARTQVLSPDVPSPHALVAFNAPSLAKFGATVAPGGIALYDRSVIREPHALPPGVRALGVPLSEIAAELGQPLVKNVVAIGALQGATGLFPAETVLAVIRQALQKRPALVAVNAEAFARGARAVERGWGSAG